MVVTFKSVRASKADAVQLTRATELGQQAVKPFGNESPLNRDHFKRADTTDGTLMARLLKDGDLSNPHHRPR